MEDIVKRLRTTYTHGVRIEPLLEEAADEIELLREKLKESRAAAKAFLRELGHGTRPD